ncbi:MAG: response regulator [Cyanobacterium sp. T60_A2020_053]|nr:response regulator [Cyanobacterium sp. T60_A2020_053]
MKANEKYLDLDFKIAPDIPEYIVSDERKLRQILLNLISNALKFTEEGSITVDVKLAEDNRVNQKLLVSLLKKLNYPADIASDGVAVLRALEKQNYDLIFMDIEMPEMDGISATKTIYDTIEKSKIPLIVAMTAHEDEEKRQICRDAGMKDYITKPIKLNELERVFNQYFND